MLRVLSDYLEHLELNKNRTFIAKIFGIFTISIDKFSPISVMIMENTMPNVKLSELHYTFDIKGS